VTRLDHGIFWACFLCTVCGLSSFAHAQELIEPLNNTLDFLVRVAQGPAAVALGILILLGSVVAFAFGRLPPSQLLQVVMVLALYFGAPRIVEIFKQVATR
jgi:type IV secretory pathway VirB2 component (pilin)